MRGDENNSCCGSWELRVIVLLVAILAWSPTSHAQGTLPPPQAPASGENGEDTEAPYVFHRGIIPIAPSEDSTASPKNSDGEYATAESDRRKQTKTEEQIARHAWQYFLASRRPATGLFDSVRGYGHATIWDIASGMAAMVAAEKLQIIPRQVFLTQMRQVLASLARMPLYNHELPNREYDIQSLSMLDAHSHASSRGSGWSAIDLGRLLIWLKIISNWYPELADPVRKIVDGWNVTRLIKHDELHGVLLTRTTEHLRQEGRLGYEQYAATGLRVWGHKLTKPFRYSSTASFPLYGISLLHDTRKPAFLTSEPFFLTRIELGAIDPQFDHLENNIYEIQRQRWEREGVLTMVSEDAVSVEPWFVYNSISANGEDWVCVSVSGKQYPALKSLSTKAAMAWWAIQDDSYSYRTLEAVKDLVEPSSGYYAGLFETGATNKSRNVNTNAIVLEAILYKQLGRHPFLEISPSGSEKANDKTQLDTRSSHNASAN
jgi:hypothetical protein